MEEVSGSSPLLPTIIYYNEKFNRGKAMKKLKKLLILVATAILCTTFLAACNGDNNNLTPNWEKSKIARERAINAQYMPNASKLVEADIQANGISNQNVMMSTSMSQIDTSAISSNITLEQYNEFINEEGSLWHPYNVDYNIYDVKDMVIYLTEFVGIFDQWFRYRGTNREGTAEDFANIPSSLADGEFYMTINEQTGRISIIQRTGFQPYVWDEEQGKCVWNEDFNPTPDKPSGLSARYSGNYPIMSDNILVINYFNDENGDEVVEAQIIEFCNYFNEVFVSGYQYMKNIKDKSFTRYVVTAPTMMVPDGSGGHYNGWGIDTNRPYGVNRAFLHIDYTDAENISILQLDQELSSKFNDIANNGRINLRSIVAGELTQFDSHFTFETEAQPSIARNQTSAVNEVGGAFVAFMKALNVTTDTINSFDISVTASNILEKNIWDALELTIAETIQNSFLMNNYQQGLNIRMEDSAPDITDSLHTPPDWEETN